MLRFLNSASPKRAKSASGRRRALRRRAASQLELLESRKLLTTFTVTNTSDVVDSDLIDLSLREAIEQANANANSGRADVIVFDVATPATIELDPVNGQLEITDDLIIRGLCRVGCHGDLNIPC